MTFYVNVCYCSTSEHYHWSATAVLGHTEGEDERGDGGDGGDTGSHQFAVAGLLAGSSWVGAECMLTVVAKAGHYCCPV